MRTFLVSTHFILALTIVAVVPQAYGGPTAVTSFVQRSSFGQPCNKTSRCDSRAWLGCYNGICDCIKPDEMIFQESIKKCVSKSGERCTFAVDDVEDNNLIFEVTTCVANATCNLEGICTCGNTFYENENGLCSPALGLQEACNSTSQCSQYQALQCQDGLCQCNESVSIYKEFKSEQAQGSLFSYEDDNGSSEAVTKPQCAGLAGKPCLNSLCTDGAVCSGNNCTCVGGFYANDEGLCLPKIKLFGNCTATSQCEQKQEQTLVCLNGRCNCDPTYSIYGTAQATMKYSDGKRKRYPNNHLFHGFNGEPLTQCLGLVDSPCLERRCVLNAFCSYPNTQHDSSYEGVCKCQDSFTLSKRGACATGYESSCSTTSTCIDDLVCRNSQCLCPYITQSFDASKKSCLSQVGGPCTANSSCEETAECQILNSVGHCACKTGYVENSTGKCKATYDTECSFATDCDPLASLQCIDQKCKCPTFAEYNSKVRKCVGLSGAKCDVSKKSESECTHNSKCKEAAHSLIPGTCTCSSGFVETANYTCEVKDEITNDYDYVDLSGGFFG